MARRLRVVLLASTVLSLAAVLPAAAQDATWLASPGSGDFNTGANWSGGSVPTGTAFFDTSSTTSLIFSGNTTLGGLTFNPGASAYAFTLGSLENVTFNGPGLVINGGSVAITNNGRFDFNGNSTIGNAVITNSNSFNFADTSTAGTATVNNTSGGQLDFRSTSTAGSATIVNQATTTFRADSTAGTATITTSTISGILNFQSRSTAGNATIITEQGGRVQFSGTSTGGNARFITNLASGSFGTFDMSFLTSSGMTAGSIEGSGNYILGAKTLTVGSNNLSTEVSGTISGGGGSLVKTGTGTLTLSGANTYSGGTTVDGGTLNIGTAGSTGSIVGAVTVSAFNTLNFVNADTSGISGITTAGYTIFREGMSAGSLSITTSGSGQVSFFGNNSAETATLVNGSSAGAIGFSGDSTAGNATITNNAGSLVFFNTSTAGNAAITLSGGSATFLQATTAGSANITIGGGGSASFTGSSTADNATITNSGSLSFGATSSAGSATITNNGTFSLNATSTAGSATITNNNVLTFYTSSSAGSAGITNNLGGAVNFQNASTAGTATITNGGGLYFSSTSTAGSAHITNNNAMEFSNAATAGSGSIITNAGTMLFYDTASAGAANVTNTGTITLNNASTAGSATILNNFSLSFTADSSAGNATITNANSLNFLNASTAGNAAITNNSALSFFSTSTAGSATIVNNGPLSFLNTSTAGSATITNNSLLAFNNGSTAGNATIANSGNLGFNATSTAGSATITNSSTLNFNGTSTAGNAIITTDNGGTTAFLSSGTGGDARFITNSGGTFDMSGLTASGMTAGSIEGAGSYNLGAKELTTGSNNRSTEVSGALSGAGGSLIKAGTGTLTLSGTNTYTGATTVNGGTLAVNGNLTATSGITVNSGGALGGTGTIGNTTIASGGTLAPGNSIGTISVNGNLTFNAGGFYTVEVSPTAADRTNVTGTATLTGATVQAVALPGSSFRQQTYTILNATGGFGGTQFAGLNVTGSFSPTRNPHLTYDTNNVYLVLDPSTIQIPAGTSGNQASVAGGINKAVESGAPPPAAFDVLLNMSGSQLTKALNQVSGQPSTSAATSATQMTTSFMTLLLNPNGGSVGGNTFGGARSFASEPAMSPEAAEAYAAVTPKDKKPAVFAEPRWSVWGQVYGGYNKTEGDTADTTARTWGLATGFDYRVASDLTLGFALAGGSMNWGLSEGLGGGKSEVFQIGAYGRKEFGPAYLSAALSYAWHGMSTDRTVTVSGTDKLTASFNAHSVGGRVETGYRFATRWVDVTPYAALQVQNFRTPSYSESAVSGSSVFALTYDASSTTSTRTELGAWFDNTIALNRGHVLALRSRAAWAHDHSNNTAQGAVFQMLPGSNFIVNGAQAPANSLLTSLGAELRLANSWSIGVRFDGEFASGSQTYAGTGTLRYAW